MKKMIILAVLVSMLTSSCAAQRNCYSSKPGPVEYVVAGAFALDAVMTTVERVDDMNQRNKMRKAQQQQQQRQLDGYQQQYQQPSNGLSNIEVGRNHEGPRSYNGRSRSYYWGPYSMIYSQGDHLIIKSTNGVYKEIYMSAGGTEVFNFTILDAFGKQMKLSVICDFGITRVSFKVNGNEKSLRFS